MEIPIPRVMIGAVKSGSGKTVLTCGLLEALKSRGKKLKAFKCGPDYIDPMFHKKIIEVPSYNLDSFFLKEDRLQALFALHGRNSDIGVLEGVMGLFDGLGGILEEGSSYEVAKLLKTPIVLVVDAHGMGRTIIPLLAGFLQYDKERLIKGVLLNRTSKGFFESVKPVIEKELSLDVLGYFPNQKEIHLESRHLGLKLPHEIQDLKKQVREVAAVLEETVDLNRLLQIAGEAENLIYSEGHLKETKPLVEREASDTSPQKARIAVARDEAFCFYYEDNLRLLEEKGAEIVCFSPLHDEKLPAGISGILLGGGYPELYGKALAENVSMKRSVKEAIESGMPSVAECGGFMYLHRNIVSQEGEVFPMCGVIHGDCFYKDRLVRFGYVTVREKESAFWSGSGKREEGICERTEEGIRGHEFHYFDSEENGEDCIATKPVTGRSWPCVHVTKKNWWGFPHLYYPANPRFAEHFVKEAEIFRDERGVKLS